jgi:hypothetical protein
MALNLGELAGIISLDEKPAMSALGKVRQGMRDTASEGQKSTDKLQAQQARFAASVENASAAVSRARQRERDAADGVRIAEMRLADAKKKGADGSTRVVAAERAVAQAHARVRASQDATAKSARDLEMAQSRAADGMSRDSKRVSVDFHQMANRLSWDGTRTGRLVVRTFAMMAVGAAGALPAIGALGSGVIAASGSVLTLAGSIKQLVGVAALAPAALFAVGSGAGVLLSAFNGMGEALKTASEQTSETAGSARLDAMTLADAARAVAQAERAAADQQVSAARRVEDAKRALSQVVEDNAGQQADALRRVAYAERDVESANRRVEASQRDLNDARREAADRIEDLNHSLEGAGLSEREAAIRLEEAQAAFEEGATRGGTPNLEYRKLKLDLDQATFALEEAKDRTADLKAEQKQASVEGVKGNRRVQDAQQALVDAQQASVDAVQARADAVADVTKVELDSARRVAEAQRDVADAVDESAKAQVQAAESVADAHRNLERVQVQQAEAAAKATEKSVDAMDKLTPSAKLAAAALLDVYERLGGVRDIAQENFFDGFAGPLLSLADTIIPQLERGVGGLASAYGAGAQTLLNSLNRELGNGVLERMFQNSTDAAYILNDAIDPVVASLTTLTDVGMSYMPELAGYIEQAANEFNTFIQDAEASGELDKWIQDGIQGFKDVGSIIESTTVIFDKLEDAARTAGFDTTLGSIADGLDRLEVTVSGSTFQDTLSTILGGAKGGAEGLLAALDPINEAFVVGGPALAEFLRLGGEIAGSIIGSVFTGLSDPNFGSGLISFMEDIQGGVDTMGPLLPGLFDALGGILENIGPTLEKFGPTAVEVLTNFANGVGDVLDEVEPLMTELADSPTAVGIFLGAIASVAVLGAMATFAGNLQAIATGFSAIWVAATGPVGLAIIGTTALIGASATAANWFFTETDTGRDVINKLIAKYLEMKNTFTNQIEPAMKIAYSNMITKAAEFATSVNDTQLDVARDFAILQASATTLSVWWAQKFAGMKTSSTQSMLGIVSGALGLKKDIDTYMTAIGVAMDLVPGYFEAAKTGAMTAWNAMKEEAKKPISFIIDTVLNNGLIPIFNGIPGVKIDPIKKPPGFKKGGYTGDGGVDEAAGIVHGREFVVNAAATAAIGKDNLEHMAHTAVHGKPEAAATRGEGNMGGFFEGNAAAIRPHGAYYVNVAQGMGGWDFPGAARLWDGSAGLKVKTGIGKHQGHVYPRERGGGILGYTTGTNIDMSPSWMNQLGATQRRTVAAHEMGHAMGLPHNSMNSIMQPNLGNMAAVPTALDIRNLQALFPGGSGKAGSAVVANPFDGKVKTLMASFAKQFPGGGMFVDAAGGIAKSGIQQVIDWVSKIKDTSTSVGGLGLDIAKDKVGDLAGDIAGNLRDFFGGAAMATPTLMDGGGWLRDTDGPQIVDHRRKKPDAFTPYDEWQQIKRDYASAQKSGAGITYAPVFDASRFEEQERHARRMFEEQVRKMLQEA